MDYSAYGNRELVERIQELEQENQQQRGHIEDLVNSLANAVELLGDAIGMLNDIKNLVS